METEPVKAFLDSDGQIKMTQSQASYIADIHRGINNATRAEMREALKDIKGSQLVTLASVVNDIIISKK